MPLQVRFGSHTLNNGIDDPLLVSTCSPSSQISGDWLINLNQPSLFVDNVELMFVNKLMVARPELSDSLVMLVHKRDVTMA
jgi:hypothetical protein